MEDAHATILSLDAAKTGDEKASFFAVYDGHGGSNVAKFSGETVHTRLAATDEYRRGEYEAALKRAFLGTDEDLRASELRARVGPAAIAHDGSSRSLRRRRVCQRPVGLHGGRRTAGRRSAR